MWFENFIKSFVQIFQIMMNCKRDELTKEASTRECQSSFLEY